MVVNMLLKRISALLDISLLYESIMFKKFQQLLFLERDNKGKN